MLGENGWTRIQARNVFLPTQIGYQLPLGIDARFPDMQYYYDGGANNRREEIRCGNFHFYADR